MSYLRRLVARAAPAAGPRLAPASGMRGAIDDPFATTPEVTAPASPAPPTTPASSPRPVAPGPKPASSTPPLEPRPPLPASVAPTAAPIDRDAPPPTASERGLAAADAAIARVLSTPPRRAAVANTASSRDVRAIGGPLAPTAPLHATASRPPITVVDRGVLDAGRASPVSNTRGELPALPTAREVQAIARVVQTASQPLPAAAPATTVVPPARTAPRIVIGRISVEVVPPPVALAAAPRPLVRAAAPREALTGVDRLRFGLGQL